MDTKWNNNTDKMLHSETPECLANLIKAAGSNVTIEPNMYISDYYQSSRGLKQRLFTLPWRPFKKTITKYRPMAYIIDNVAYVSFETYLKLKRN